MIATITVLLSFSQGWSSTSRVHVTGRSKLYVAQDNPGLIVFERFQSQQLGTFDSSLPIRIYYLVLVDFMNADLRVLSS